MNVADRSATRALDCVLRLAKGNARRCHKRLLFTTAQIGGYGVSLFT
jgi:hypothetical protein